MSSEALALVTVEFIEKVLKNSESDQSIEVKELKTKPAVAKGDNYGSNMIRASVKYLRKKSDTIAMETISIIIKIALIAEGPAKELIKNFGAFESEINMMQTTLADMNDVLNEKNYRLSARVLYAEIGDPSFLVIEDLAPLGYRMADRLVGLDLGHCLLAMKNLAKFHASSVAVCEKDPKPKTYNKGLYRADHSDDWKQFFVTGVKGLATEILNWTELGANRTVYSEKLLKFSTVCYDKAVECMNQKRNEFTVLNHGDFWINNMLFRYDDEGRTVGHIFVDFQEPLWSSPSIDIWNFFETSLSEDVDLHHRDTLLKEYLNMLTETMCRLRCKTKPPTMDALKKSLSDYELYGVLSSLLILPVVILDKTKTITVDDMMRNDDFINPGYKGEAYRKIILRRLPGWIERGLIDD